MNEGQRSWLLMFFLGLFLIIVGIQGNLGQTFAIIFVPKYVSINDQQQQQGSSSNGSS